MILITGTLIEFIIAFVFHRCGNCRFWHVFYIVFENVCMFHIFCNIFIWAFLWNSMPANFLCPCFLDHLVKIIMFIRSSKPFCPQDYLGVFKMFGRCPSNCQSYFWPLFSVKQCLHIYRDLQELTYCFFHVKRLPIIQPVCYLLSNQCYLFSHNSCFPGPLIASSIMKIFHIELGRAVTQVWQRKAKCIREL